MASPAIAAFGNRCLAAALAVASGACTGEIGDLPAKSDVAVEAKLAPAVLPRLTQRQYDAALRDLLGEELPETPAEPDTNPYLFFSIGATTGPLSELGVEQLEKNAIAVTSEVFADPERRAALLGCAPAAPGDDCVEGFLRSFGRRAFRRTLEPAELARWVAISVELAEGDALRGVELAAAGMLQAPAFIYRVELGEPDPDRPDRLRYTGFEMASRISFLLWDAPPDDALLDAAESGQLHQPLRIEAEARRLLADPRARGAVRDFFSQYLDLGRLGEVTRDASAYPDFTPGLPGAMRAELLLVVDDLVFRRGADVRELFSTRRTFVNTELAELYGVEAEGATPITFVPVELPESGPRAGILTLGGFLTMNAHAVTTSPTLRGKYVRERVLCDTVPAPPPDVDTGIEPNPAEPKTMREQLEQHRQNPACQSCHEFIDPPGFLFENFDAVGGYRTLDNGYPIDSTGELDGVPLENARELADVLATHERVGPCMVKQLYRHAHGRLDTAGEAPALEAIHARFAAADYQFEELLVAMVTDDTYRFVAKAEVSP